MTPYGYLYYVALKLALLTFYIGVLVYALPIPLGGLKRWAGTLVRDSALHLEFAMREGRSKGLYIIYASQLPSDVGSSIVENTGVKVVFGGFTSAYAEMASQLASLPVGYALVRDEQGRTRHVKVLDFGKLLKTLPPLGLGEGVRPNGQEPKTAEGR